jgi:hypothetical protein
MSNSDKHGLALAQGEHEFLAVRLDDVSMVLCKFDEYDKKCRVKIVMRGKKRKLVDLGKLDEDVEQELIKMLGGTPELPEE